VSRSLPPGAEEFGGAVPSSCRVNGRGADRMSQRQRAIAEQLSCGRAPCTEEATVADLEPEADTPQVLAKLGRLRAGMVEAQLLSRSAAQVQLCEVDSIKSVSGLNIQGPEGELCHSLPPSHLPSSARAALASWAYGRMSGARCFLEVEAAVPAAQQTFEAGKPSWCAIASVCGLAGGAAFASGRRGQAWLGTFGQTPAGALRCGLKAVRTEAEIEVGPITVEELHLGLRALELKACCGDEIGSAAARLQTQAWRELLSIYLSSEAREALQQGPKGLAELLGHAFQLGASGIEQEARTEEPDSLRVSPAGWEECSKVLAGMARALREALETIRTYGPYTALGVEPAASDADLKRAYRELCLVYHPDKGGDTASFQQLQEAYERIVDERKRGVKPPPPPPSHADYEQKQRAANSTPHRTPKEPSTSRRNQPSDSGDRFAEVSGDNAKVPRSHDQRASKPAPQAEEELGGADDETIAAVGSSDGGGSGASTRVAEALQRISELCALASEAAERTAAAHTAASAAVVVIEDPTAALELFEASPELEAATRDAAEDAEATAVAVNELASHLAPACSSITDGGLAEEVLQAAFQCTSKASTASTVASTCGCLADEVAETFQTIGHDLRDAELGSDAYSFAMQLLAAAARRGREAAKDAATAAAAAAQTATAALAIVRRATRGTGVGAASGASPRPWRSPLMPPRSGGGNGLDGDCATGGSGGAANSRAEQDEPIAAGQEGSSRQRPRRPGSARARSSSAGPRGWTDALVQRRLQAFEDLKRLDAEVQGLQREMHEVLLRSPLLLRGLAGPDLRSRIFGVVGEVLQEIGTQAATATLHSGTPFEPLCFLDAGVESSSLCDVRLGAVRLAALIDVEALQKVLTDQFLPVLLAARPASERESLRASVTKAVSQLHSWVACCDHS